MDWIYLLFVQDDMWMMWIAFIFGTFIIWWKT